MFLIDEIQELESAMMELGNILSNPSITHDPTSMGKANTWARSITDDKFKAKCVLHNHFPLRHLARARCSKRELRGKGKLVTTQPTLKDAMQTLSKLSSHQKGEFGGYEVAGTKYSGEGLLGWQVSTQVTPHDPSSEYWVANGEVRTVTVGAMPDTMSLGPIVTLEQPEHEAIFAAVREWEKVLSKDTARSI